MILGEGKMKKALTLFLLLSGVARSFAQSTPAAPAADTVRTKSFTAEELKKYNGENGAPVYVAVDGVVYDLSKAASWKNGVHMKTHKGGRDLSKELHNGAPAAIHKNGKVLEKFPRVGVLVEAAPAQAAPPAAAVNPAPSVSAQHKIAAEELGKEVRCTVTGKKIKVAQNTPAVDYKGKTYYFSQSPLAEKFSKNPEKYIGVVQKTLEGLFKKKSK